MAVGTSVRRPRPAVGQEGINLTSSFIDGVAFFQITDKGLIAIADVAGTRFWVADTLN